MALYFITGIAGAGKTSVWQELKARGYQAYDTDEDGFSKWQNKQTGYIHPKSSVKKEDRTEQFIRDHSWNIPRTEIEDLVTSSKNKVTFLCGVAGNYDELKDLFEATFALAIDDTVLKQRLQTRVNNSWGKQPHELQQTLDIQHTLTEVYAKPGYIVIDATQPLTAVVDEILGHIT